MNNLTLDLSLRSYMILGTGVCVCELFLLLSLPLNDWNTADSA